MDQATAIKFIDRIGAVARASHVMVFNQATGRVYAHNLNAMRQSKALIMFILSEFEAEMGRALMSPQSDWLCLYGPTGGAFICRIAGDDVVAAITHEPDHVESLERLMRHWSDAVRQGEV